MIEMHQDDDSLGDDEDFAVYPGRGREVLHLAVSAPALAIAALVLAFLPLGFMQAAQDAGDTALFSSNSNQISDLRVYRVAGAVRLAMAVVALVVAGIAGARLRLAEFDDDPVDPYWVRAVVGAALVVAVVAVVVSAAVLLYALQVHTGKSFGN
jgi:hypothetical protein